MKKLLLVLLIFLITIFPTLVLAQEEESQISTATKYFDIKIQREKQSVWNKAVTYVVYVTPKIDSKKTQIIWDAPTNIEIVPKHAEFVDMYKDQTYTFKSKVKTDRSGSYEITVNLIAWQHDTNYTNSVSDIITFNQNLLATPIDQSYTYNLIGKYLIIALVVGLLIWGGVFMGKKGLKSMKKWLTPPN